MKNLEDTHLNKLWCVRLKEFWGYVCEKIPMVLTWKISAGTPLEKKNWWYPLEKNWWYPLYSEVIHLKNLEDTHLKVFWVYPLEKNLRLSTWKNLNGTHLKNFWGYWYHLIKLVGTPSIQRVSTWKILILRVSSWKSYEGPTWKDFGKYPLPLPTSKLWHTQYRRQNSSDQQKIILCKWNTLREKIYGREKDTSSLNIPRETVLYPYCG